MSAKEIALCSTLYKGSPLQWSIKYGNIFLIHSLSKQMFGVGLIAFLKQYRTIALLPLNRYNGCIHLLLRKHGHSSHYDECLLRTSSFTYLLQ